MKLGGENFSSNRVRLGVFEIDAQARRVFRNGLLIEMQSKTFALLACLIERSPETVSHDEIKERVWGGAISDDAVKQRVSMLRRALGEDSRQPHLLETVHGEGYRLAEHPVILADIEIDVAREAQLLPWWKKLKQRYLAVAVLLPLFVILLSWSLWPSETTDLDGRVVVRFETRDIPVGLDVGAGRAEAIRDEILHELVLLGVPIILLPPDSEATGELILSGGLVGTSDGQVEYSVDLVTGSSQRLVASFSTDASFENTANVHAGVDNDRDIAALRLAYMIWPFLDERLIKRADLGLPEARLALAEYRLGFEYIYSTSYDSRGNELAIAHFQAAIEADPELANAHAFLADALVDRFERFAPGDAPDAEAAIRAAGDALALNDDLAMAHMSLGRALWLTGRQSIALGSLERAVELQPGLRALRERYTHEVSEN